jgi:hypothetical protein
MLPDHLLLGNQKTTLVRFCDANADIAATESVPLCTRMKANCFYGTGSGDSLALRFLKSPLSSVTSPHADE